MQGTRQAVVELLRQRTEGSVRELATALGLTQMSVRLHLAALTREGFVTSREIHRPIGRPSHCFRLTEKASDLFPRSYARLADLVFAAATASGQEESLRAALIDELMRRHGAQLAGGSLEARVEALAEILAREGFTPSVEADGQGLLLRTGHCPYEGVAARHGCLCDAECGFISLALGGDVLVERVEFRRGGDRDCSYRLRLLPRFEVVSSN
jgi:predicted ArsR family transcriptional regulator